MKSYMKDRRKEVDTWNAGDESGGDVIIEKGMHADTLLAHLPKDLMMCEPIVIGKDEDGLVVEWCYSKVIFTLARAHVDDPVFGRIEAYGVQKIEEITND